MDFCRKERKGNPALDSFSLPYELLLRKPNTVLSPHISICVSVCVRRVKIELIFLGRGLVVTADISHWPMRKTLMLNVNHYVHVTPCFNSTQYWTYLLPDFWDFERERKKSIKLHEEGKKKDKGKRLLLLRGRKEMGKRFLEFESDWERVSSQV